MTKREHLTYDIHSAIVPNRRIKCQHCGCTLTARWRRMWRTWIMWAPAFYYGCNRHQGR